MSSISSTITATAAVGYTISTVALGRIKHSTDVTRAASLISCACGRGAVSPALQDVSGCLCAEILSGICTTKRLLAYVIPWCQVDSNSAINLAVSRGRPRRPYRLKTNQQTQSTAAAAAKNNILLPIGLQYVRRTRKFDRRTHCIPHATYNCSRWGDGLGIRLFLAVAVKVKVVPGICYYNAILSVHIIR